MRGSLSRARCVRALALGLAWLGAASCIDDARRPVVLGVSTSVEDSGLLDVLWPEFQQAHPEYRLRAVTAGSGELLALGARGDVDVLISHSPESEQAFMEAGHGLTRRLVMTNDFVIVGPPSDPARVRGMRDGAAALAQIARAGVPFLSRGDDSGTHRKELELREAAGLTVGGAAYRELGQGQSATLNAASELRSYALSDLATFLTLRGVLKLEILVRGDPRLINIYSVIAVKRAREPEGAEAFADWLTSAAGQAVIARYGVERFGVPLFRPSALGAGGGPTPSRRRLPADLALLARVDVVRAPGAEQEGLYVAA